jgi:hypothetical protein
MVLVWKDIKSFQRHLEVMRTFRQSHSTFSSDIQLLGDMPASYEIDLSYGESLIIYLTYSGRILIFIPIWKIVAPPGSQN